MLLASSTVVILWSSNATAVYVVTEISITVVITVDLHFGKQIVAVFCCVIVYESQYIGIEILTNRIFYFSPHQFLPRDAL